MLAGDRQPFEDARPVLEAAGKNLYFCGERLGDGQTVRMVKCFT